MSRGIPREDMPLRRSANRLAGVRTGILMIGLLLGCWAPAAFAYIGPGAGLGLWGAAFVLMAAFVLALAALLSWPIRRILRAGRKRSARASADAPADPDPAA